MRDVIDSYRSRFITKSYKHFHEKVYKWVSHHPENINARTTALYGTLVKYLKVAVIILDTREKPHVIFKILNTCGDPLKQADLVKNTVMYEANVSDNEKKARHLWEHLTLRMTGGVIKMDNAETLRSALTDS